MARLKGGKKSSLRVRSDTSIGDRLIPVMGSPPATQCFAFASTLFLTTPAISAVDIVKIDGSSTIYPITEAVAEDFQIETGIKVTVGVSGTGGGFKKFCRGDTVISGASRPIKPTEIAKLLQEKNKLDIKPSMIQPKTEIKSIGKFKVKIILHSEVDSEITINVVTAETIQ